MSNVILWLGLAAIVCVTIVVLTIGVLGHRAEQRELDRRHELAMSETRAAEKMAERDLEEAKTLNQSWYRSADTQRAYVEGYMMSKWGQKPTPQVQVVERLVPVAEASVQR